MGMVKIISPDSYNFEQEQVQLIKVSSYGLRGSDLGEFIKRANHEMANVFKKLAFEKDEIPIHLIALGSTEKYGNNRNGDGFSENACRKYHNTFVKNARFFRDHKNKDKAKSYGIIKHSMYNEDMGRIELIIALNGT